MSRREDYDIFLRATDQTSIAFASARRNIEQLNGAVGTLKGGVGALAAVFAGQQIVDFLKDAVSSIGEIGTAATRVGVATDALQALRFEASQNGAQLQDADAALQKFADQASKAGTNSNYLGKVFQANGIAIKDSNGVLRSATDLLQDYGRLVLNATSPQDKLRLSVEAFGRNAGPLMVKTLEDIGKAGVQGAVDKASLVGVIVDPETIDKADKIDKKWKQIAQTFETQLKTGIVLATDAAGTLIDTLLKGSEKLAIAQSGGAFSVGVQMLQQGQGAQLKDASSFYDAIFRNKAKKTILPLDNDAIQKQIDTIAKHVAQMQADALSVDATAGAHEALRVKMQLLEVAQQHGIPVSGEYAAKIADIAERAKGAADALAAAKLKSDIFFERAQLGRTPFEQTVAEKLRSAQISTDSDAGKYLGNQIRINEALKTGQDLATNFADSVAQSMLQGKSATEALRGALMQVESQLISMVTKGLVNQLFGAFLGNIGGGVLPGGAPLGAGGIGHAAGGGSFGAGDWSWVGESGPELVRFGQGATVIPSSASAAMSSPKINVQVNHYTGGDTDSNQRVEQGPDGPQVIVDIVKKAHASGAFDDSNRGLYGLRRQKVR